MEMAPGCIALSQNDLSVGYAHMDVHKSLDTMFLTQDHLLNRILVPYSLVLWSVRSS